MKDENKTKAELIKELKTLRKELGESALNDITKRKQAEEEIKSAAAKWQTTFNAMNDAVSLIDYNGIVLQCNQSYLNLLGKTETEILGKYCWEIVHGTNKPIDGCPIVKMKKSFQRESMLLPIDDKWFNVVVDPIFDANNNLINAVHIITDITERKQAEEALRLHAAMMDNVAEGVYMIGLDDLLIKWTNEKFARMFGYDPGEMVGKQVDIVNAPTERTPTETRISIVDVLKETGEWHGEVRNIKRDGTHFWCYANVSLFDHPEYGKVIVSVHTDITERKQAEDKLLKNQYYLTKAQEIGIIGTWELDIQKNILIWTDENYKIFGVPLGTEMNHELFLNCIHPDDRDYFHEKWNAGLNNEPYDIELRLIVNDKVKWVREKADIEFDTEGNPIMAIGFSQDITERKQAEQALKKSEEKYRTVFENTGTATLIIEEDTFISMVNTQFEKLCGYSKDEIENKIKWTDFVIPEDLKMMVDYHIARRKAGENPPKEYEFHFIDRKGNIKNMFLKVGIIPDSKRSIASLIDITERKQAEEKIKHLNLVIRAIRNVNQLIVKEKNRERLLKGACENLVKTRGYHNTWIALLDEEGNLKTYAEAGLGKAFLPIVEILKKGELIVCGQKALKQQEVVTIKDPASTCSECPLIKEYSGRGAMTTRLEYNGKVYGLMSVSIPTHITVDQEEQSLFKEVAEDIAFGLRNIELDEERKQAEENLKNAKNELQIILDSVPAIIFYKDTEGRIVRANKTLANSLKIPVKDIIGRTTEELFPKKQAENMRKDDEEVIISGKPKRDIIQPYDTPEGTRWAITDKMPYKDKEGKVTGVISLSKDITVQRKSEQKLKTTYQRLKKTMDAAIDTMSKIIEAKDPYTSNHQHRVCQLAVPLARELGLSEDKVEGIRIASLIHDIGKIGLPTEILSKPGKLSDIEFSLIKDHSQIGYDILKSIDFSYPIARIVLQHHERLNGSGYPDNLKGDKILLEAKILGVSDVVEAISSFRPYRPALGIDVALEEIIQNKVTLYDPEVVDACLRLFKEKGFKFE